MERKKIIIYSILFAAVATGIFLLATRYGKRNVNAHKPEFMPYVAAYTYGTVSKVDPVRIRLTSSLVETLDSSEIDDKLIYFRPSIKGELKLIGTTLEFTPDETLPSDKEYYASFKLKKIADVPSELSEFNFEFRTIKQAFDYEVKEHQTIDKKTLKYQRITGVVNTADVEDEKSMAEVFTAKQKDRKLAIKWASESGGMKHYFTIDSVERYDKSSDLFLQYDGDVIDAEKEGDTIINIPSITDFSLMSAKVIQKPDQYLKLQFSDPLDPAQNLEGLIEVKGSESLNYIIEDNIIKVFTPKRLADEKEVTIHKGIKNILGYKLDEKLQFAKAFTALKPEVRFTDKGNILPSSKEGLLLPFEAVNLSAVDLTVIKIYEKNIMQFLQTNDMDGGSQLRRVGIPVLRKTIDLAKFKVSDKGSWNRYNLDLAKLFETEAGAIYRVEMNFRQAYSLYQCSAEDMDEEDSEDMTENSQEQENWEITQEDASNWDIYEQNDGNSYYYGYWDERNDPCKPAYYGSRRKIARNVIASDLGIIAKQGTDKSVNVFVTDIKSASPKEGVAVELYDYQQKLIAEAVTDEDGKAAFEDTESPYFTLAKLGKQRGYLKTDDGNSLSVSRFDVSGTKIKEGLKGYIYGERGVWRPGDSLFLTFVLKEEADQLPQGHPLSFEFTNPRGQLVKKEVQSKNKLNFYTFVAETQEDAPTGNYNLKVSVGPAEFNKTLKVETIKPNRLKINLDFEDEYLSESDPAETKINVKWLHGAIADNLKVEVDASLTPVKTNFGVFNDYSFDDPTKSFSSDSERILEGKTDENGDITLIADLNTNKQAPGMLKATFVTRAYETGGNFSIDQFSKKFSPYESYTGIKLPKGDKTRGMLLTDKKHKVEIVCLSPEGKIIKSPQDIKLRFYKIDWRWWWDESANSVSNYNFKKSAKLLDSKTVKTKNGKAEWEIEVKHPDWGRYLVLAENQSTGHRSGKIVYIDWPGWAGRAQNDSEAAAMLSFSTDKEKYEAGEEVTLSFPGSKGGRALVSIENGTKVLKSYWVETKKGQTEFKFTATKDMAPNIYANITLLQKHAQTANDRPIRMYGIKSIPVENKETILQPVIKMPDEIEAEKQFTLEVSEKDGKEMTYTVAVVDEGLLDLTRFRTPNPWDAFYAKEALGVKTWDLFDQVLGAYSGDLSRLIAVGGDAFEDEPKSRKANRFKPVVKFLGPFKLKSGSRKHTIKMPKYIGSVRTMVVAGEADAYGSAEKTVPVIKPLMAIATLPRVLGPKEKVKLPVSVFAMKKHIKNVSVTVKTNGLISVNGSSAKSIKFAKPGEEDIEFDLDVSSGVGIGRVEVIAKSGSEISVFEIEIDVRNPNHRTTDVLAKVLEAGESWNTDYKPVGVAGTNIAVLEVSNLPPVNLGKRLKYLIKYPHGCIEQTTSAVFPQLFVSNLMKLDKKQKSEISDNIKAGLKRLNSFQLSNGGFSYWPGNSNTSEWGTSYVGHFLTEAERKGYPVSPGMLRKWRKYQRNKARNWSNNGPRSQMMQAYRLYTLALAGHPETGSMNRLKANDKLSTSAKWRLAAAYQLAGKKKTAEKMVAGLTTEISPYKETGYTYGSQLRDRAMILETMTLLGKKSEAFDMLKLISEELSANKYLSTQTTAYSLIAVSAYADKHAKSETIKFEYKANGKSGKVSEKSKIVQRPVLITGDDAGNLSLQNKSGGILYARLILSGVPEVGTASNASNKLSMSINYMLPDGTDLSPVNIPQGTDFIAQVTVSNPGTAGNINELALSHIFPSGWEIINTRLFDISAGKPASSPEYTDIRDDRVYNYFDLQSGKSKTFKVLLNASYAGKYWMPPVYCEAMYDASINARRGGTFVNVVKP